MHLGNKEFDEAKEGEDLEFEVVGSTFKQKDTEIVVVGKLLSRPDDVVLVKEEESKDVVVMSKQPEESGESVKQVVFSAPTEGAVLVKGKRKKLTGNQLKEETNE